MRKALDQTGDLNGQQLYRLTRLYSLPGFVKSASSDDIYGVNNLETHQYGDPVSREFPCHTSAATYVSTLFFLDKQAELDPERAKYIAGRLDDFAFMHGITDSVKQLKEKLANASPKDNIDALDDSDFALVIEKDASPTGKKERHYPLRNALEVKKAAEFLREYNDEFAYVYRHQMAHKILEKAAAYGAGLGDLDEYLQKQAGMGACSAVEVAQLLFDRARLLKRAQKIDYAVQLGKMAKTIAENPGVCQDNTQLVKLAGMIDKIDEETGLRRLVDDLQRPENVFFNITEKAASQLRAEHFATRSGNIYKLADFDSIKLADVRDVMGNDFADAVSYGGLFVAPEKLAEIVPTLPRGDADLFDRLLTSCGIQPFAKEAAHERGGFDNAELLELAGMR